MKQKQARQRLMTAGRIINGGYSKTTALRKLFISEKRDWKRPGAPRVGWKRGELCEVTLAIFGHGDITEEWGDVAYYTAQSYDWLWTLYATVTPKAIIKSAVKKFERRARRQQ